MASSRSGLVVVDMQNTFCREGGRLFVHEAQAQLGDLADAIGTAREAALPVIYTQVIWKSPEDIPAGLRANDPSLVDTWQARGSLGVGTWGSQIVDAVSPQPGDHVLSKKGFHCPGLAELARDLGLTSAYLTGTTANNCVYAAALALFEANLEVLAIKDLISSFGEEFKVPWLQNIAMFLGRVITLDDFRQTLSASEAK